MKGYGLPRNNDVSHPDCADINNYGLKSSSGHLRGKGGDIRSSFKSSDAKKRTRRIWKKKARREGQEECQDYD